MRITIASAVALGIRRAMAYDVEIQQTETTSGCPVLKLTMPSGDVYNLTITKARKK